MFALALLSLAFCSSSPTPDSVAIVGSGIAGSATAFFLHKALPDLHITIFEASTELGGRTHTLSDFGIPVDAGATAISSLNQYLVSFVEMFNLTKADDSGPDEIGLWDGTGFRFRWGNDLLLPAHVLARYGPTPLLAIKAVRDAVDKLVAVYALQANGTSFDTPGDMFERLGLTSLTQQSAYDMFSDLGIDDKFVYEFVDAMSRDNYGQPSTINGFVDLVSLAGAGIDGDVFELADGTQQLSALLLKACGDQVSIRTSTTVTKIEAISESSFSVLSSSSTRAHAAALEEPVELREQFAGVVIATPLENAHGLKLERVSTATPLNVTRPYQQTCVTFVAGAVDSVYFGLAPTDPAPTELITVENVSLPFTTLAVHADLGNGTQVYKLFSRDVLSDALLDAVFLDRHMTRRLVWDAYPQLLPSPPTTWPPFRIPLSLPSSSSSSSSALTRSVMYTGAMESPVSCMETQVVAARNAALLLQKQFMA